MEETLADSVSRRLWKMEGEAFLESARRRTGLGDFGFPPIKPALPILASSIEREANLHPLGRFLIWNHLRGLLETRLRLTELWNRNLAGLKNSPIERPIFITGMPRSGSTFLHELLAQDLNNRAPLVWEVMFPFPLTRPGSREQRKRIRQTAACLWGFRWISPRADSVHPLRATTPHECIAMHSYTLLSQEFATILNVPGYEAFLDAIDLAPAYAWEKRFLQHLQGPGSVKQWVLKSPDHAFSMEALFNVFPDAIVIQTHRNPFEVLKSCARLTEVLRRTFARPADRKQAGEREAGLIAKGLDRVTRFRDSHPELSDRFLDLSYQQITFDPLGAIRQVYRWLDLPLTDKTTERVRTLAAARSRYSRYGSEPAPADFGIDRERERARFRNYCERFGIASQPAEGIP